jgi:hypothetical protein
MNAVRRWLSACTATSVAAFALASGCSTEAPSKPTSASHDAAPFVLDDTPFERPDGAAPTCRPRPVAQPFEPTRAYRPPLDVAVCTDAQIDDFIVKCLASRTASVSVCNTWTRNPANAPCFDCVMTPTTDAKWGPFLSSSGRDGIWNAAGCYAITLGEGESNTGCGAAFWVFQECMVQSCHMEDCAADINEPNEVELQNYDDCSTAAQAAGGPCHEVVTISNAKCSALNPDGAPRPEVTKNCAPGYASFTVFARAIITTFCGGAPVDGGTPSDGGPG